MVSEGEVYYDDIFNDEMTVVSIEGDQITIDGPVGEPGPRTIDTWRVEHNISVGRYEKLRDTDIGEPEVEKEKNSIFDF